jgi:hypothetical protein
MEIATMTIPESAQGTKLTVMAFLNKYGALHLPEKTQSALYARVRDVVALTGDMTPEEARTFELAAIETVMTCFAEARLRRAANMRQDERARRVEESRQG